MWIRYHIKCHNCSKVTNLRLQLTSTDKQEIVFSCPNPICLTSLEARLHINYLKFKNYKPSFKTQLISIVDNSAKFKGFTRNFHESLNFEMIRGEKIQGAFNTGDYFLEYSDGLPVSKATETVHDKWTPLLRENQKKIFDSSLINELRTFNNENNWNNFSDLIKAYQIFNCDNIKIIIERIKQNNKILERNKFDYSSPLGFINAYYFTLNHFLFPWIDFEKHTKFIELLFSHMFSEAGLMNAEIEKLSNQYTQSDFLMKFNDECSLLILRFIQLRPQFKNTYQNIEFKESIISNPDFVGVKNFFTDCFEFIGRYSFISLQIMNLIERGGINTMPSGMPRNILTAEDFKEIDHGSRLDILTKCTTSEILEIFNNRFDSKLRNGINHNKTKFDLVSQIISYYPNTKRPNEEFKIAYDDFLIKTLNIFESVLRVNQFIKMFHYFNRDKKIIST